MGRGRQKAKATRQAREMKYFSPETDYSALERELSSAKKTSPPIRPAVAMTTRTTTRHTQKSTRLTRMRHKEYAE